MSEPGPSIRIQSYRGKYELRHVVSLSSTLAAEIRDSDILFVDEKVAHLHKQILADVLSRNRHYRIEACEAQKSFHQIEPVIDWLIKTGFKKNHRLIAVGGGIVQDICSFISSIIYRGVDWVFIPTSLLAQCDSCIGSKTSINFGSFKNQLGNFYPPVLILRYDGFLRTLSREEIRSGMGEMMHYFLISGIEDMTHISERFEAAFDRPDIMSELIRRSLEIKKEMIEIDEFDRGPRNIFNYGHSFGHAIESYTNYAIAHGIAVSFGMDIANELSFQMDLMPKESLLAMREVLEKNWWPCNFPEIDIESFIAILGKDKKNRGNVLRVVLSRGPGDMFLSPVNNDRALRDVLVDRFGHYRERSLLK